MVFYRSTTAPGYPLMGNRRYPEIVTDFEHTFAVLRELPCDVFLAPHGSFFNLDEKRARIGKGAGDPSIDPSEMHAYVERSEAEFHRELHAQRQALHQ